MRGSHELWKEISRAHISFVQKNSRKRLSSEIYSNMSITVSLWVISLSPKGLDSAELPMGLRTSLKPGHFHVALRATYNWGSYKTVAFCSKALCHYGIVGNEFLSAAPMGWVRLLCPLHPLHRSLNYPSCRYMAKHTHACTPQSAATFICNSVFLKLSLPSWKNKSLGNLDIEKTGNFQLANLLLLTKYRSPLY